MTWQTHIAIGANAAWITALGHNVNEWTLGCLAAGAFASLLPDLDAVGNGAKIHHIAGGLFSPFKNGFRHRGFLHSIFAGSLVFITTAFFLSPINIFLPFVITFGYMSHPFIDGFNLSGVQYLFPGPKKFNLVPRFLRAPVKGWSDQLLFALGLAGILLFLFRYMFLQGLL